jgi:hypothetical protein
MRSTQIKLVSGKDTFNADNLSSALQDLARDWIRMSRRILDRNDKNASGNLRKSMSYTFVVEGDMVGVKLLFDGAPYWVFVEYGVKGFKSDAKAPDSPFQFGTNTGRPGGLRAAIDKWVIVKGLPDFRDMKGRFVPRKDRVRMISRKIYLYGIEPTPFVSDPMAVIWDRHISRLELALQLDLIAFYEEKFPTNWTFSLN